jgi:hypothetical protein
MAVGSRWRVLSTVWISLLQEFRLVISSESDANRTTVIWAKAINVPDMEVVRGGDASGFLIIFE